MIKNIILLDKPADEKEIIYCRLRRLDARRVVLLAARLLPRARLLLLFRAELERDAARLVVFRATFLAAILHLLFLNCNCYYWIILLGYLNVVISWIYFFVLFFGVFLFFLFYRQ